MTLDWILGWWNLIYLAPFLVALTYLGVYVMTGMTFGEADVDHDAGMDHDVSVDHDLDVDHDVDVDHDIHDLRWEPSAEVEHEVSAHADADPGAEGESAHDVSSEQPSGFGAMSLLYLIGFGKVPLSLMVMILLICWGITGFATNQLLHKRIADGDTVGLWSLPITAAIALVMTALLTRAMNRVMPRDESTAKTLPQLVGQEGVAILAIDDHFGLARVHDGSGVGIQVPCRVAPGQEAISANRAVVLMRFDRTERLFYVTTPDRLESFRAAPTRA